MAALPMKRPPYRKLPPMNGSEPMADKNVPQEQLLHMVIGGELSSIEGITFADLDKVDIVGLYPNYAAALVAWKQKAQMTVDSAQTRYFIVHLHRLLDPQSDKK